MKEKETTLKEDMLEAWNNDGTLGKTFVVGAILLAIAAAPFVILGSLAVAKIVLSLAWVLLKFLWWVVTV
jgi:hypothetical protein